jgi:flagellar biosynthetic protein FliQ
MDSDAVLHIGREALLLTLILSALPVLAAMLVGLLVSVFQAATQIQEQTLTFVPKIIATFAVLAIGGAWMLQQLSQFSIVLIEGISDVGR